MKNTYYPVIGLEIHVELKTKSKMFCQCSADYFGKEPNTNTCPVCLGLPGALPVPNRQAVEWTVKIGQALGCTINTNTKFDRKHYFYPDLPKGYQISQYDEPIAVNGALVILSKAKNPEMDPSVSPQDDIKKKFSITRVHLEEDTGKLTHAGEDTLVDFNRSSVPLVEIVTEPQFENSEDVKRFLEELHTIIRYLEVSDADMEKGSMRMEPNISLSIIPDKAKRMKDLPAFKVEVKNINSFNFAKRAIDYELIRQAKLLDEGKVPPQETRGYNEDKGITYSQRSKENAHDYRYFPDPDIPPISFEKTFLEEVRATIPELPSAKCERYVKNFGIKTDDAFFLTRNVSLSAYFEEVISSLKEESIMPQNVVNAMINKKISTDNPVSTFVSQLLEMSKPIVVDESALSGAIEKVLSQSTAQITQYKAGKTGIMGFFVGQVMKEMKGKVDPKTLPGIIEKAINV